MAHKPLTRKKDGDCLVHVFSGPVQLYRMVAFIVGQSTDVHYEIHLGNEIPSLNT